MLYYPLQVVFDTLVFTAEVLMWSAVKVAELVYIALYHLVFSVIAGAVPLLGKVILGLFYVVANVLEVLLNVLTITFSFILTLIQTAVQYVAFLLTTLFQLCGQLFHLDWPMIFESIGGACVLITSTILDGLSSLLNAIVYLVHGLGALFLQVATFILSLIQAAMLYVTLLITALSHLCVQLFHAAMDLDWATLLETIRGGGALVINVILDGLSLTLNATMYLISALVAFLFHLASFFSSVLVYITRSFITHTRDAVHSVQLLFGNKPLLNDETVATFLLVALEVFCIYVLYSLSIFCIRSYLRHKAKLRRQRLNAAGPRRPIEVNAAGPRRPIEVNAAGPRRPIEVNAAGPRRPIEVNPAGQRRLVHEHRARPLPIRTNRNREQVNNTLSRENESWPSYRSSQKEGRLLKKGDTKPGIQQNPPPKGKDESASELIMHTRLQELETELMKEKEAKQCVVCMDRPREIMMRPCNHYCVCEECSGKLSRCPICTKYFLKAEKIFNV